MLIVDTAGRLHVDDELMDELAKIKKRTKPHDVLLVVDAMTGQDAVNVAEAFAEAANFDGVILTKLDGDARGGAALSVKAVTGKPILYASTGEKLDAFERFHPDRMAQRILGMGDVMTLVEKAEKRDRRGPGGRARAQDPQGAVHARRLPRAAAADPARWGRSGPPEDDPRHGPAARELKVDERELDRLQAIITSMTPRGARATRRSSTARAGGGSRTARAPRPGGQPARQAVRPDAEDDAARCSRGKMPSLQQLARRPLTFRRRCSGIER